ncbi:MAG TPA: PTS sugar transporter subunit IIC [Alcaligenaceae bacterium]|nr:PTS sugar transporter subunit IIC [Alcaligenaceae bacterium]
MRNFLARKNIEFSLRRYGIETMNYMTLGLFGSLIIGLILKTTGNWLGLEWLIEIGGLAQAGLGAAIGVGVAYGLQAPPMVIFSSAMVGSLAISVGGGPVGAFVAVAISSELSKLVHKTTPIDIIITPATALISGMLMAQWVAPYLGELMRATGQTIEWAMTLQPFFMSIVIAVIMGMVLTGPTSSAAVAISLELSGLAAGAATIGCCAQMVGFAAMSYRDNGPSGVLGVGLGTSMLQLPNIIRNPLIWIPPILTAAILAPIGTLVFKMENIPTGAGMGTSGFVGQVGTLAAMGGGSSVWLAIGLMHILFPTVLCLSISWWMQRRGWIKPGDLTLRT